MTFQQKNTVVSVRMPLHIRHRCKWTISQPVFHLLATISTIRQDASYFDINICHPLTIKSTNNRANNGCRVNTNYSFMHYNSVFTAWCYASASLSCVCLSVCLSHSGTVLKQLNLGSCKQRYTIAQRLIFLCQRLWRTSNRITPKEVPNTRGVGKNRLLSTNNLILLENGTR